MRIGFLNNQIDNRGTGNAVFDYAHYNEEILGNESVIFTLDYAAPDPQMLGKLIDRFGHIFGPSMIVSSRLDALYHIKYGYEDGFLPPRNLQYLVHAVFDAAFPHGDKYATISEWMGNKYNQPWVPHIVDLPETDEDFRDEWCIPEDAVVFGRYGGKDTFDISFVWEAIQKVSEKGERYFALVNTDAPTWYNRHVKFRSASADPFYKRKFINTCDYMLHARRRGETFGIAVGEFSKYGKPVITYLNSPEKAHIFELLRGSQKYIGYENQEELEVLLDSLPKTLKNYIPGYTEYTPENVMAKFKEVFLADT